jgi:hypothetical protein
MLKTVLDKLSSTRRRKNTVRIVGGNLKEEISWKS